MMMSSNVNLPPLQSRLPLPLDGGAIFRNRSSTSSGEVHAAEARTTDRPRGI
jgi:hypothetical protein